MMMDCKKSSGHTPVVYISWLVLVSSIMAPFSKAFEHLCWYIICPLSFVVFQLFYSCSYLFTKYLQSNVLLIPWYLLPGYHAFLHLCFCKVPPHTPSSGF